MGRMFEKRKHKIFARNAKISKLFTKYGREIAMLVKQGGPYPDANAPLRQVIQNAKSANMPKERIESAIKKASDKSEGNFEKHVYEGHAPHGIAVIVETATDNATRTVANIRMYFNKSGGSLGNNGSVDFLFTHFGVFQIDANGQDPENLELELIDYGAQEIDEDNGLITIYTAFQDFGKMQNALEKMQVEIKNAELQKISLNLLELPPEKQAEVETLLEKIETDDDVTNVFHNLAQS